MSDLGDSLAIESSWMACLGHSKPFAAISLYLMGEVLRRGQEKTFELPEFINTIAENVLAVLAISLNNCDHCSRMMNLLPAMVSVGPKESRKVK